MSYKIAVVSGKGGTGKTTVSVSLLHQLHKQLKVSVHLVDCDVEEPNDYIFFNNKKQLTSSEVYQDIPVINAEICSHCKVCADFCTYNAIVVIPSVKYAKVENSLCHSCGACVVACQKGAVEMTKHSIGTINQYQIANSTYLTEGVLKVGSSMQTMLIKELKRSLAVTEDVVIFDAPPGTSCSVVATVIDADFVIVVAEPTPFGLHDFKIVAELLMDMKKPFGVIVNKSGIGNNDIYDFINIAHLKLMGSLPFDRGFAEMYAEGSIINDSSKLDEWYHTIIKQIERRLLVYEGANNN